MKECDKRNSHISSKLRMIYLSSNNDRHPVTNTFTPLHYTWRQFTASHLNFTQPVCRNVCPETQYVRYTVEINSHVNGRKCCNCCNSILMRIVTGDVFAWCVYSTASWLGMSSHEPG